MIHGPGETYILTAEKHAVLRDSAGSDRLCSARDSRTVLYVDKGNEFNYSAKFLEGLGSPTLGLTKLIEEVIWDVFNLMAY